MHLFGVPISDEDCRTLIDLLQRRGSSIDLELATRIETARVLEKRTLALAPPERTAILTVLTDPPDSLAELRRTLSRDHRERKEQQDRK